MVLLSQIHSPIGEPYYQDMTINMYVDVPYEYVRVSDLPHFITAKSILNYYKVIK